MKPDSAQFFLEDDLYIMDIGSISSDNRRYVLTKTVTRQYFIDELEENIYNHCEKDQSGFLSSRQVPAFDTYFYNLMEELRPLKGTMPKEDLTELGEAMIARLKELETDDEFFPAGEMEVIREIIS